MKIFLLSGLGADKRLFSNLDLSGHEVIDVSWVPPSKGDTMETYARKLVDQVNGDNAVLMGVSFGGMVAVEMGKVKPVKKIILISSSVVATELPALYRFAGKLKIHRLISGRLLKNSHRLMNWVMGAADPVRKKLLADMLRDTDPKFLYWAIDKVVTWKNETVPSNVVRIHGSKDRVLPVRKTNYLVDGGGHLIVANRADEVTKYVNEILA
ncbi:MAG TPA: alpha/beta hydrolase [Cyclobacteriaceae bacterium]|nr:alpha/beta hydrolase [Cyclobacteriaceae bacterium]